MDEHVGFIHQFTVSLAIPCLCKRRWSGATRQMADLVGSILVTRRMRWSYGCFKRSPIGRLSGKTFRCARKMSSDA